MALVKKLDATNRHPMAGKTVKFAIGNKESLLNSNKRYFRKQNCIQMERVGYYILYLKKKMIF